MKKILCDKDGKFLSVHEKNETFVELKDGDCLTHEDGCISICKEYGCKEDIPRVSCHVHLRNNELHFLKTEMSFSCHDSIPSYRFSTEEEEKKTILKVFLMIRKGGCIWAGRIVEYRGMTLRKVRPGKYAVISPCSFVPGPVYIDKNENLNVL